MKLKVHFIGALEGDQEYYKIIIRTINGLGYKVITDHSAIRDLEYVKKESKEETELYVQKMQYWIRKSDIVVVDVTYPGFGIGFEIAVAINFGKPIIVIHLSDSITSAFNILKGLSSLEKLQVLAYTKNNLQEVLDMALDYAKDQVDTRFTMNLPSDINIHLNTLAGKNINKSEYIRKLIREDMKKAKESSAK